ncbi:MAG TPA: hypothetical protein VND15_00140 [Candidatus Acidoferrales bacterium]|nr:hypothetical protein [Candidatus Acidoferrales bacterium]
MTKTTQQSKPFSEKDEMRTYVAKQTAKAVGTAGTRSDTYRELARIDTIELIKLAQSTANSYKISTTIVGNDYRDALRTTMTGEDRVSAKMAYLNKLTAILFVIKERASGSIPTPEARYEQAFKITTSEIVSARKVVSDMGDMKAVDEILKGIKHTGYHMAAVEAILQTEHGRYTSRLAKAAKEDPLSFVTTAYYFYGGEFDKKSSSTHTEEYRRQRMDIMYTTLYILNCGIKVTAAEDENHPTAHIDYPEVATTLGPYEPDSSETIVKRSQHSGINITIKQIAKIKREAVEFDADEEKLILALIGSGDNLLMKMMKR